MTNSSAIPQSSSVSIIIRTLNEEKWLGQLLDACQAQIGFETRPEIIVVDSGSTDRTLEIARKYGCKLVQIHRSEFSFGRSANLGCSVATGDYLVLISAHCIPQRNDWLANLVAPIMDGSVDYAYGRQVGHEVTRFSEHQVFAQYYGPADTIPTSDIFCNNANSALSREVWAKYKFNEEVTGLEDMLLGSQIFRDGGRMGYVAEAPVVHIHDETLKQVKRRYYREALTMHQILPQVHFYFSDFLRYLLASVLHDASVAARERVLLKEMMGILGFRTMQYWGTYLGHNEHRVLSRAEKESYYYPGPRRQREAGSDVPQSMRSVLKQRNTPERA